MPSFYKSGDWFFVSVITGPTHISLRCKFSTAVATEPVLVRHPALGDSPRCSIDESRLRQAVIEGVDAVSKTRASAHHLQAIHYVADDTPDYDCFRHAARLLARRVTAGESFVERE